MNAIYDRRSIRKYEPTAISHDDIKKIIHAGIQAPSPKNRQPWRFVVIEGDAKNEMIDAMNKGLEREIKQPSLPHSKQYIPGVQHTISIMEQTPVTIFIINPCNRMLDYQKDWETHIYEAANLQSVGACIQNMLLTAAELGYGSLWNCDIYFAYEELLQWLDTSEQIVAAVSFGVPAENPGARPRKDVEDVTEWRPGKESAASIPNLTKL